MRLPPKNPTLSGPDYRVGCEHEQGKQQKLHCHSGRNKGFIKVDNNTNSKGSLGYARDDS